jgi:hypothetical protein
VIKYYGFDFPPVGIIGILEQLASPDNKFYILDPIGGQPLPYHELNADCWVIITTNEGSSHRWFDRLIPQLESCGVPRNQIVIRSSCLWDPDSPVRHIHTIVDECSDFVSTLSPVAVNNVMPTHHYVCMNRGHRWQRYALVKNLLDRGLDQHGTLTYIELPLGHDSNFTKLTRDDPDWHEQRSMTDPGLNGALFNIVTETAFEPEHTDQPLIYHHRPGMTEKSYKCFALWQIPIWLAPYRAVACYRQLGFDVFDDVVDHSYDLELDPVERIGMIADQVSKICRLSLQDLQDLKTKMAPRFQHNLARLKHYANNFDTEIAQWQVLFLRNNTN